MRRIILLACALLLCGVGFARKANKVEVTLNNGTVVTGTTKSDFYYERNSVIEVTPDDGSKKKVKYPSTDVKSVRMYDEKEGKWLNFVTLMAQGAMPSVFNKTPKAIKYPVFAQVVYEGKNVSGYMREIRTVNNIGGRIPIQKIGKANAFYFKVHSEEVARWFWMSNSAGWKAEAKLVFKDYPEMKDVIENFDGKEFGNDCFSLIRKFDEVLSSK